MPEHLGFEFAAFHLLSRDRQIGFDLGPIPWSSMDGFALRYGIVGDDFDRFVVLMAAMDNAYRANCEEKNKAKAAGAKTK